MLADEGFERVATARQRGLFAAKLVATPLGLRLGVAGGFHLETERRDLGFQALQALGNGFERQLYLAAFKTELGEFLPGDVRLGEKTLGLAVKAGEGGCRLGLFVARLRGALQKLHAAAATGFNLLLGLRKSADGVLRSLLLRERGFAGGG